MVNLQRLVLDGHQVTCNWLLTTNAQCEYRATHRYCPHPEHACDCRRNHPSVIKPTEKENT